MSVRQFKDPRGGFSQALDLGGWFKFKFKEQRSRLSSQNLGRNYIQATSNGRLCPTRCIVEFWLLDFSWLAQSDTLPETWRQIQPKCFFLTNYQPRFRIPSPWHKTLHFVVSPSNYWFIWCWKWKIIFNAVQSLWLELLWQICLSTFVSVTLTIGKWTRLLGINWNSSASSSYLPVCPSAVPSWRGGAPPRSTSRQNWTGTYITPTSGISWSNVLMSKL